MSDYISRKDAIDAVHKYFVDALNNEPHEIDEDGDDVFTDMKSVNALLHHNKMMSKALKALPSAEAVSREFYEDVVKANHGLAKENSELKEQIESAEAVQGWIPCSERLPSAEDCPMDCMVTRRSKYVGNYTDMAVAEADGTWTHEDWKAIAIKGEATCISTRDADIIAWMPLPNPYREDGEA